MIHAIAEKIVEQAGSQKWLSQFVSLVATQQGQIQDFLRKGAKPSQTNGSLKPRGAAPLKLQAIWFLKYQNVRLRAYLMDFYKRLIKCMYNILMQKMWWVRCKPSEGLICIFVAALQKLQSVWFLNHVSAKFKVQITLMDFKNGYIIKCIQK